MRKVFKRLVVLVTLVVGIGTAVAAEPVYVGKKVTTDWGIEKFVSYDTDFDWSTVENVEVGATSDFYMFQEDFNIYFEVGVTYTFSMENSGISGFTTFQRLEDDVDGYTKGWRYYTNIFYN